MKIFSFSSHFIISIKHKVCVLVIRDPTPYLRPYDPEIAQMLFFAIQKNFSMSNDSLQFSGALESYKWISIHINSLCKVFCEGWKLGKLKTFCTESWENSFKLMLFAYWLLKQKQESVNSFMISSSGEWKKAAWKSFNTDDVEKFPHKILLGIKIIRIGWETNAWLSLKEPLLFRQWHVSSSRNPWIN